MIAYDRLYAGVLMASVTSALINLRIVFANISIIRTKAGILHTLSNLLIVGATITNITDVILDAFRGNCQTRLWTTCAAIQLAKVLNHVILFWRCEAVTMHHKMVRYLFAVVITVRLITTNTHCGLLSAGNEVGLEGRTMCISILEPISTQITIAVDVLTDIVLTCLFMVKIFEHSKAVRRHVQHEYWLHSLFKEFLYEAVPMLIISFVLNVCIFSGVLGRNTEILIHIDLILQLRLANDLLVLNRLSRAKELSLGVSGTGEPAGGGMDGFGCERRRMSTDSFPLKAKMPANM
ncbi:hypothetical protein K7432_014682 [Basidiobolus ranarum]|uniref:Uncharacterized protein n=1 Tax=Basidiobolus ranarum TaxID=34480 RepID=A0ABR2WH93_9FUNG